MLKFKVNIKPFSINCAWQGKRYKTPDYKRWRQEFNIIVPKDKTIKYPIKGYIEIKYEFFLRKYKKCDAENFIKPTSDALVESGIIHDDRFIKKYTIEKYMLNDLDEEHIEVEIKPWEVSHFKHHPGVNMKNIEGEM
jgi:Holliday junction resolvase RusA-like endonuclease